MATIKELLAEGVCILKNSSESAGLDSQVLLSHVLRISKAMLISNGGLPVSEVQEGLYKELIARRANFEPVAYLTGTKEFYGLEIHVTPDVLIPRPETELLVELALDRAKKILKSSLKIIDLGTGSGCIPLALATELSKLNCDFEIDAVDKSNQSLKVAIRNAEKHGLRQANFFESNWFSKVPTSKKYDIIISNPPYIAERDKAVSKETVYEPRSALYAGMEGLDDIRQILATAPSYLEVGGCILIEIGSSQGIILNKDGKSRIHKDLAGNDRVLEVV